MLSGGMRKASTTEGGMKPKTTINTTRIVRMYCLKWR